jgi:hypothetical protein
MSNGGPRGVGTMTGPDIDEDADTGRDAEQTDGPAQPEPDEMPAADEAPDRAVYLPVASHSFAIVQYEQGEAPTVRRVIGMFGDAPSAELYADEQGYPRYVIVPATVVIARAP